jgi:hypothetical protein
MNDSLDLFVFADALGWRIAEENSVLTDLLPHRAPCETVFGYSSTCDPTILTGVSPREHGHFSFFVKARGASPFKKLKPFSVLPHRIAGHHRVRNQVSKRLAKRLGYTGYFMLYSVPFSKLPFLEYTEKHDIYQPGGIIGGQRTIFEHWEESGRPWFRSDWRRSDIENIAQAGEQIDRGEIELAYLFTSGLDAVMHAHGTSGKAVTDALSTLEGQIHDLHERATKRYRDVRIHVFSDHGMADTRQASGMMRRWESLGLRYGKDYVAVWDSTMARFWFENDSVRKRATSWLSEQKDGRIVADRELAAWGCDFPDQRYGELFYLLPAGTIFAPSHMNLGFVNGMHGYDPAHEDSTASWLTNSPSANAPRLQDIFAVMKDASKGATSSPPHSSDPPMAATV